MEKRDKIYLPKRPKLVQFCLYFCFKKQFSTVKKKYFARFRLLFFLLFLGTSNNKIVFWGTCRRLDLSEVDTRVEAGLEGHLSAISVNNIHGQPPLGLFFIGTMSLVCGVAQNEIVL